MKNKIVLCIVGLTVASVFYYRYKKSKEQKDEENAANLNVPNANKPATEQTNITIQEYVNHVTELTNSEALPFYESESNMTIQHYKDNSYRLVKRSMIRSIIEDLYDAWEETSDNVNFDKTDFEYALAANHGYSDEELNLLLEDCNLI